MNTHRAFWAGMALLGTVTAVGTVGFMALEDVGVFDSFYTTMITLTTVGFGELEGGFSTGGRILAIFVVVGGVGAAFYTAAQGLELAFERLIGGERQNRRTRRMVSALSDHIIVCGYGRVGRSVIEDLRHRHVDVVVIEIDSDRADWARDDELPVVEGDATHNAVLEQAGIGRARGVVAAVRHDADNLVITLSAKSLYPNVVVVARSDDEENSEKTLLAGADQVVAPQVVGAKRLAALVDRPQLVEFIDLVVGSQVVQVEIEKCIVSEGGALVGRTLRDSEIRSKVGALVLAIEGADGSLSLNPDPDTVVTPGSTLMALGSDSQLQALRTLASSTG